MNFEVLQFMFGNMMWQVYWYQNETLKHVLTNNW